MRTRILILSACLATATATTCVAAEGDSSVKQDAKDVGRSLGELAHDVGHDAKKTAKAVGHTARDVTRKVGHAFRDGAKETKKAAKGESEKRTK